VLTTPAPGSALTAAAVTFGWSAGSAVSQYWLSVGTTGAGSTDVYDKSAGSSLSATVSGLPVDGRTVNVRLWSLTFKIWQFNDYTYSAATGLKAAMSTPTPGSTLLGNSVTFSWTAGNLVSQYWLSVGTTGAGSTNLLDQSTGTNRSGTVGGLPLDGRTVNVRLWSLLGKNWQFTDYTYTAATAQGAVLTSPTPGAVLSSATVTFAWTAGNLASQYWLYVGTTAAGADLYNSSTGLNLSATANNLPDDGRTLYVRLWSLISGNCVSNDYTYQVSTARPVLTVPPPGSALQSNSVTFAWSAGVGVSQYWLYVGSFAYGGTDLYNQSTQTILSATLNCLPIDGRILYVRLWSLISGNWVFNDYTYKALPSGP